MSEATSPDSDPSADAPVRRYVANEKPVVDYAAKARDDAAEAYYKKWDKKDAPVNRHGHIWRVIEEPINPA